MKITIRNTIILFFAAFALFILNAGDVCAQNIAAGSAILSTSANSDNYDYRVENLRNFLNKYNSPLAEYSRDFVAYADMYNLDYRLVPAITGVESTFGKRIPKGSYNAYGWSNGEYTFASWEDSIAHVSNVLKTKYFDKGIDSISEIARVYAPPSNTWSKNVSFFISKIDALPVDFDIVI